MPPGPGTADVDADGTHPTTDVETDAWSPLFHPGHAGLVADSGPRSRAATVKRPQGRSTCGTSRVRAHQRKRTPAPPPLRPSQGTHPGCTRPGSAMGRSQIQGERERQADLLLAAATHPAAITQGPTPPTIVRYETTEGAARLDGGPKPAVGGTLGSRTRRRGVGLWQQVHPHAGSSGSTSDPSLARTQPGRIGTLRGSIERVPAARSSWDANPAGRPPTAAVEVWPQAPALRCQPPRPVWVTANPVGGAIFGHALSSGAAGSSTCSALVDY
jgi:hypothetical protein